MSLHTSGIDHINMQVRDLEQSCQFYQKLLGFTVLEDMPEHQGKIIGGKQALLALYQNPDLDLSEQSGFNHVCFHIENFDDIKQQCKELGIEIKYDGAVQWPHSKSIYIDDPNGYEIELAEVWGGGLVQRS